MSYLDHGKGREFLLELADLLDGIGQPFFLMQGTALGARRDRGFTPTERDVDLGFLAEEFRAGDVAKSLLDSGFEIETRHRHFRSCHTIVAYKNGVKADLVAFFLRGEQRYAAAPSDVSPHYCIVHDRELLETYQPVELFGQTFRLPSPVETYLEREYGDWRTPREDHVSRTRVYDFLKAPHE